MKVLGVYKLHGDKIENRISKAWHESYILILLLVSISANYSRCMEPWGKQCNGIVIRNLHVFIRNSQNRLDQINAELRNRKNASSKRSCFSAQNGDQDVDEIQVETAAPSRLSDYRLDQEKNRLEALIDADKKRSLEILNRITKTPKRKKDESKS